MTLSTTALVAAAPTLLREGLVALLRQRWPQLMLTVTADASQAAGLVTHYAYGLIVLEGALPGLALPGFLALLQEARPGQHLLLLADADAHALEYGAGPVNHLLVPPHVSPLALVAALAPWLDLPADARPQAGPAAPRHAPVGTVEKNFSPRELEVLRLVVADHCNQEIADRLYLSVRTVESHRRTLLHKAGTRTLVGLAARAVREGWVA